MALAINTNINSLNAQRNLTRSSNPLDSAMKRLSSGLRINSAKDDAAGLSIATRMTSQIRGLSQAMRNANDGLSVVQTAEGAIEEITSNLERMRELAAQAAHGIYTSTDRSSMNAEFTALRSEVQRIASQTKFNDTLLLDGSFSTNLHVGYEANQTIAVSITSMEATSLTGTSYDQTLTLLAGLNGSGAAAANTFAGLTASGDIALTVSGTTYNVRATADSDDAVSYDGPVGASSKSASAIAVANAINEQTSSTGVTARASAATYTTTGALTDINIDGTTNILRINNQAVSVNLNGGTKAANSVLLQNAINNQVSGVAASIDGSNNIVLTASDGRNITVYANNDGGAAADVSSLVFGQGDNLVNDITVARGGVVLNSQSSYTTTDSAGVDAQVTGEGAATANQYTLNALSLTTTTNANTALTVLLSIRNTVSSARGDLGAVNNRLESTVSNISNIVENVSAARSRIMDADFAAETANLTKSLIMQQAGISVLAQANSLSQNVLALLQR